MVKVGLVTSPANPSPAASPLTNSVFPAPRSPIKLTTVPPCRFLTKSEAINRVWSGLLETRTIGVSLFIARNDRSLFLKTLSGPSQPICRSRLNAISEISSAIRFPIVFSRPPAVQKGARNLRRLATHFQGCTLGEAEDSSSSPQSRVDWRLPSAEDRWLIHRLSPSWHALEIDRPATAPQPREDGTASACH